MTSADGTTGAKSDESGTHSIGSLHTGDSAILRLHRVCPEREGQRPRFSDLKDLRVSRTLTDGDGEKLEVRSHFGNRTLQNPVDVCTHLLSASALQVCPQPSPATRARVVFSGRTLELGSLPAAAVKPLAPRPILATCLPAQVHCPSSFQILFGKYTGRTFPENVLRMSGTVQLPGTEAFSPHCVFTGCGPGPSVTLVIRPGHSAVSTVELVSRVSGMPHFRFHSLDGACPPQNHLTLLASANPVVP